MTPADLPNCSCCWPKIIVIWWLNYWWYSTSMSKLIRRVSGKCLEYFLLFFKGSSCLFCPAHSTSIILYFYISLCWIFQCSAKDETKLWERPAGQHFQQWWKIYLLLWLQSGNQHPAPVAGYIGMIRSNQPTSSSDFKYTIQERH